MHKTEGLVKYQVVSLKPIKILYDLMFAIFTIPLQTCTWKQCFPVHLKTIVYHTGNVCCIVVIRAQLLYYSVSRQIKIQQKIVQKYVFMFTVMSYVVLCTENVHTTNKKTFNVFHISYI